MLSISKTKFINSLKNRKHREKTGCFIIEGEKMVGEALKTGIKLTLTAATQQWMETAGSIEADEVIEVNDRELKKISSLTTPNMVLAVAAMPEHDFEKIDFKSDIILALDAVRDPGNLGAIIRTADWFGIENLVCSPDCADIYSGKVVQATMGAIFRVRIFSRDLEDMLTQCTKDKVPVYGTFPEGGSIYEKDLTCNGVIVMGNESRGINNNLHPLISGKLYIPSFPHGRTGSESLNVSVAAAIVCSEFRRRITI
ncbi:MAG: RNA methyltransferase [Bacteroidetes bacterium]|nr:RNA methyltransferase [Bacteroidota bacterium]